jgi:hypothetical protein
MTGGAVAALLIATALGVVATRVSPRVLRPMRRAATQE